jgi:phosphotransferase system HPr-like phosphotransfer protein
MQTCICVLNCRDHVTDGLHMRPASFIVSLCKAFPEVEFRLFRTEGEDPVDPTSILDLQIAQFLHGEETKVEVQGRCEIMAARFFKLAWENLGNYGDDPPAGKKRLIELLDAAFLSLEDPDLDDSIAASGIAGIARKKAEEARTVAIINDRLHMVPLVLFPKIIQHFGTETKMAFEVPSSGVHIFDLHDSEEFDLDHLLSLSAEVGTRVTLISKGPQKLQANEGLKAVLENLWQCDEWLRRRPLNSDASATSLELLAFAERMARNASVEFASVKDPLISNILTEHNVLVNPPSADFGKEDALNQLLAPHARQFGLDVSFVASRLMARGEEDPPLRDGFAVTHVSLERSPRISLSFGVYPKGVKWGGSGNPVRIIAMILFAEDTRGTYRDFYKKLAIIFRTRPNLQSELLKAKGSREFLEKLREAELGLSRR